MELFWNLERTSRPTDEEGRIYEQVIQKSPDYLVAIYDGATVDPVATERDGRTRYKNVPMVAVKCVGEKDFMSEELNDSHRRRFPSSIAFYEKRRDMWAKMVPIELLPGITPADIAELADLGLKDVTKLIDHESLPENLEHWRTMAKRFATLSKPRLRLVDGKMQEVA